jgi:hypothetical protein
MCHVLCQSLAKVLTKEQSHGEVMIGLNNGQWWGVDGADKHGG